jgi:hypothetical protein
MVNPDNRGDLPIQESLSEAGRLPVLSIAETIRHATSNSWAVLKKRRTSADLRSTPAIAIGRAS